MQTIDYNYHAKEVNVGSQMGQHVPLGAIVQKLSR